MKLIDIDNVHTIESHIHYIKNYKARAIIMDLRANIFRYDIEFSIEHSPVSPPKVKVSFREHPHFPVLTLITKLKTKICEMNDKGSFASVS